MNILAQIFGLLGSICWITSASKKKKKDILIFLLFGEALFALNFLTLKAYAGLIVCIITIIEIIISYSYKNKDIPKSLIIIFLVISLLCGIFIYENIFDILPIASSLLYTIAIYQKKEKHIRRFSNIIAVLWIIYDLIVGAYTGFLADILYLASNIKSIIKYDRKKLRIWKRIWYKIKKRK